jgi:outer membrane lipoprotein SlyB
MRLPTAPVLRLPLLLLLATVAVPAAAQATCDNCGRIESIQSVQETSSWTPLGSVAVAGDSTGRTTTAYNFSTGNMVTLGAAGGAGYARRSSQSQRARWEIVVRMDAGGTRSLRQGYEPALRVGDRVRVFGTQVELAD